jgi:tetratricopeptide (TPR) repeat protein
MSSKARKSFDEGVRAAANQDDASAAASFQQALNREPNAYPALYNLGVLADRTGNEQDAIAYYRRALQVIPDYEPAARGIATIQIRRGRVQDAVATIEPLANQYRANLELQALYAEVLVDAKRLDEAWMAARRALKCDERFVPALIALVKVSRAQGREELADSILEQAIQIDPDVAELHFMRGEKLETEPGELREAMASYERAVQLRPNYAEARMALGIQLLAGGNYPGALSHFQAAERLVPTLPAVHVDLGDAYRATKQWTDAQREYRRALELQPKLPEAHYGLGLLFLTSAGDFPGLDELSAYEKAVQEFKAYRDEMGPRLAKDDQSEEYLLDLDRMIQRARRRIEHEHGGAS